MGPYDTMVARQYEKRILEVIRTLEEQEALGEPEGLRRISKHIVITTFENERADHWSHPIYHKGTVYLDGRPFYNRSGGVRNQPELQGLITRGRAEYLWRTEPKAYEAVMRPAALVFSQWVSAGIGSRFAMPPTDTATLRVLAAAYYLAIFLKESEQEAPELDELRMLLARTMGSRGAWVPPAMIEEILENATVQEWLTRNPTDLHEFCRAIKDTLSTNVGDFTPTTLLQLMSVGSWIGHESTALAAMALEYPPVLVWMIALAETSNMYRTKTRIGRACAGMQRTANLKAAVSFVEGLEDADERL